MADKGIDGDLDVGNDISQSQVAIGRGNRLTSYQQQQETVTWREFVRRDLESLERHILILLIAVMVLYFLGGITTGLVIRQFDMLNSRIEKLERSDPPYIPYYPGVPMP